MCSDEVRYQRWKVREVVVDMHWISTKTRRLCADKLCPGTRDRKRVCHVHKFMYNLVQG